jgi:hypothetical protein
MKGVVTRSHVVHTELRVGQTEHDIVALTDRGKLPQINELLEEVIEKSPGQFDFADEVTSRDSGSPGFGDQLDHAVGLGQ